MVFVRTPQELTQGPQITVQAIAHPGLYLGPGLAPSRLTIISPSHAPSGTLPRQSIKNNKRKALFSDLEIRILWFGKLAWERRNVSVPDRGQQRVSFSPLHDGRVLPYVLQTCDKRKEKKLYINLYSNFLPRNSECLKQSFTHSPEGVCINVHKK